MSGYPKQSSLFGTPDNDVPKKKITDDDMIDDTEREEELEDEDLEMETDY